MRDVTDRYDLASHEQGLFRGLIVNGGAPWPLRSEPVHTGGLVFDNKGFRLALLMQRLFVFKFSSATMRAAASESAKTSWRGVVS